MFPNSTIGLYYFYMLFSLIMNSSRQPHEGVIIIFHILQMKKLRSTEIWWLAQGHNVNKWSHQDPNARSLIVRPTLLTLHCVLPSCNYQHHPSRTFSSSPSETQHLPNSNSPLPSLSNPGNQLSVSMNLTTVGTL